MQANHVAFIPDGNRRWAKRHAVEQVRGYRSGFEVVKNICKWLIDFDIKYATFYVFSMENWNRSSVEIDILFNLFKKVFNELLEIAEKYDIRILCIGDASRLPQDLRTQVQYLVEKTKDNKTLTIVAAFSYSGRDEIIRAAKKMASDIVQQRLDISDVNETIFESYLDTNDIPPPDLIIRTTEKRISNFLLWQSAYAEFFFVNKYWPDFNEMDLKEILNEFSQRERRYGK